MAGAETLNLRASEDGLLLVAQGQIDAHTSKSLDDALASVDAGAVLSVELAEVSFIDSSGLRVLVRALKRQRDGGGQLILHHPSKVVVRLLEITGLSSEFPVTPR